MNFDIKADYFSVTNHFPNHSARPIIGITGNFGKYGCQLAEGYYASIEAAGGIPLVIPPSNNLLLLLSMLDRIDGLMLSGGADINPLYFGEDPVPGLGEVNPKRDRNELLLIRLAYDRQIPMLGICRGIQSLAIALGGTVHQDLRTAMPEPTPLLKHDQEMPRGVPSHYVTAEPGSIVARLLGERFAVNSVHHQAVADPGKRFRTTAYAADGVIEAIESNEKKSIVGVQWHPECFLQEGDKSQLPLFRWFVEEAESYRRAVATHRQIVTLDSHTDTPMFFDQGVRFVHRDPKILVDMHKLTEGHVDAVVMAAYLPQGERSETGHRNAGAKAYHLLGAIKAMVNETKNAVLANSPNDIFRAKNHDKRAVLLGIENGYAIGHDLANIELFRREGVIYMTLCHNGDNDICDSAVRSKNEHNGLSDFGREVVREMNRVGMLIDLSHACEKTFYDVLNCSNVPVVCTHSCCRALCDHPRNLTDAQLQALAEKGGVVQITFYKGFLREDGKATIDDVVAHILHAIEVAGIDHVGIGSDFDGDGGVPGLASAAEMINLTRRLMAAGLNQSQLRKIWGGNFIHIMSQARFQGEIKL